MRLLGLDCPRIRGYKLFEIRFWAILKAFFAPKTKIRGYKLFQKSQKKVWWGEPSVHRVYPARCVLIIGWESVLGTRLKTTQYPCKIDCLSILRHCLTLRSIGNIITEVMAAPNGCCSEVVEIWSRTRKSMILSQKTVREIDDSNYLKDENRISTKCSRKIIPAR